MDGQSGHMEPDDLLRIAAGIVDDCSDPAFLVSMEGRILAWNGAACEFFGVTSWGASRRNCATLVRGHTPQGDPVCIHNCPIRQQLRRGLSPRQLEMVALLGPPPSTARSTRVHHLPVTHPDAGPVGILHILGPAEAPQDI